MSGSLFVLFGSCLRSTVRVYLFWEKTSGVAVFSASWFDSGYILMPVYEFLGVLSPYSAQCLVLSGPRYAPVTEFASSIPLSWCRGRFPWSCCSADHSNSPVAALGQGDRWPCCAGRALFSCRSHARCVQRQMLGYVSQMQLINKVVDTPVVAQCLIPVAFLFETIEIPLLPCTRWSTSVVYWSCDFHSCRVCGDSRAPTAATRGKSSRSDVVVSCRDAEADSHGPACLADHRDFAVAVRAWWSMSLLCRSCWIPGAVVKETVEISQLLLLRNPWLLVVLAALRGGVGMKGIF